MEHQVKAYAFIAPSLLILTVFVFIPLAGAIGISLMNIDIYMKISLVRRNCQLHQNVSG